MKTLATIRDAVIAVALMIFPLLVLASGVPAHANFLLIDDATGGDCALAGTWEPGTKTCTLISDLYETIEILNNGIMLEGNGHSLTGIGQYAGVIINGLYDVTVRNLEIKGFTNGIVLNEAYGALIDHNTVHGTSWGIWVNYRSSENVLVRNQLYSNGIGVQISWYSFRNVVESNEFAGNLTGINLGYTYQNEIVNNEFNDNMTQLAARGLHYNLIEANYWNDFDEPAEGCDDAEPMNGFCDEPYEIVTSYGIITDAFPATSSDVDTIVPVVHVEATPAILEGGDRKVDVLIDGFAYDSKSGVAALLITLEDEYGYYDQVIADFGTVVTLKAKCDNKDYDGRTYLITATAVDGKGNEASAKATVLAPY